MSESAKPEQAFYVSNIVFDILLALITCGLYNLYVNYRQMMAVNDMLKMPKYNFFKWLVLTIITCGIYHVYHEYQMTRDIVKVTGYQQSSDPALIVILSVFGFTIIVDAIQQSWINRYYGAREV